MRAGITCWLGVWAAWMPGTAALRGETWHVAEQPDLEEALRTGLAPYTSIVCGGKLYSSGYAGGPLFVYDPAKPWVLGKGRPPDRRAPDEEDPASNPRRIGEFRSTRVAIMHDSALGADGRIYFGGFGIRSYTGGGFGWYDPESGRLDGFWRPPRPGPLTAARDSRPDARRRDRAVEPPGLIPGRRPRPACRPRALP